MKRAGGPPKTLTALAGQRDGPPGLLAIKGR